MRLLERCLPKREDWYGRSNAQFYTTVHPHTMGLFNSREGVIFISANGCGYEKGKNTKIKNRKRFFTFLYPLLSVCKISIIIFFEWGN